MDATVTLVTDDGLPEYLLCCVWTFPSDTAVCADTIPQWARPHSLSGSRVSAHSDCATHRVSVHSARATHRVSAHSDCATHRVSVHSDCATHRVSVHSARATHRVSVHSVPHTGYPSTLTVPHTGYPSTLPVPHTGYPSTLPVPHTDSTRLCHTSEKLLSLITTLSPSVDVNTVQSVSSDSSLSSWIPYLSFFLRLRLYEHGIHCRQLPCSPRRPKKMRPYSVGRGGRGRRRIPVLNTTTDRQPPSSCRSGWDFCSLVSVSVISGSDPCCRMPKDELRIALLYAQSYGSPSALKCTEIAEFVTDNDVDLIFLSETLLEQEGDVGQCDEVTPAGCSMRSFPRPSRGGGLAVAFRDSLARHLSFTSSFSFIHSSFQAAHVTLALPQKCLHFFCVYLPPSNRKTSPPINCSVANFLIFSTIATT